jgi:hypothetical protein
MYIKFKAKINLLTHKTKISHKKYSQLKTHPTWYYLANNEPANFITIDISINNQVELCTFSLSYKEQGIGPKLGTHAIQSICSNDFQRIQITIQDNNTIAKKLYESWHIYPLWE